ncbi:DmX-like protein 1 [Homalodisca vitripennis]|nr:DmX-like protein 1 [Homalodisca vitripennis]
MWAGNIPSVRELMKWEYCREYYFDLERFPKIGLMSSPTKARHHDYQIATGILTTDDTTRDSATAPPKGSSAEWSSSADLDWSQPVSTKDDELVLNWDDDEKDDEEKEEEEPALEMKIDQEPVDEVDGETEKAVGQLDIMAQQLKFVACLKILMEELSTLATGYEVDGGQLRYQLYLWLEREVEALRQLCNYSPGDVDPPDPTYDPGDPSELRDFNNTPTFNKEKPTLHEILMAETSEFEAKVQRAARRKKWLKANETLLRTLLSYCSLHGASGGGLASVRMELVLLLQELQQEKTQQLLLSPLPFPTTLPLLSASVACNKTVVADPVRHLQSLTHDMLQTIVELRTPPTLSRVNLSEVFVLRDLSVALSSCIYQSLCDSDSCSVKQAVDGYCGVAGVENLSCVNASSHLIASSNRKRRYSTDEPVTVSTQPSKWPGVTNLRALLAREKDEDTPRLNVLLCEAFVAAYMSLIVYAVATCDCHILYRLAGQRFTEHTWASLFGGGVKKLLRVAQSNSIQRNSVERTDSSSTPTKDETWTAVLNKQRMLLNMKLLGQFASQSGAPSMKEDKPTYREQFVPPDMSMVSYFLSKGCYRSGKSGKSQGKKQDWKSGKSRGIRSQVREKSGNFDLVFSLTHIIARMLVNTDNATVQDISMQAWVVAVLPALTKELLPLLTDDAQDVDYDSADSAVSELSEEEEEDNVFEGDSIRDKPPPPHKENTEHSNPASYSWCVMRLAIMKLVQCQLQDFLNVAGIELQELPVSSPLIHGVLRVVSHWQDLLKDELEMRGPPPADYIPGCYVESSVQGPPIHKYRSLLDKNNTPFQWVPSVSPPWMIPNSINRSVEVIAGVGGVPSVSPPWMTPNSINRSVEVSFSVTLDDLIYLWMIVGEVVPSVSPWIPNSINRSVEVIVGVGGVPSVSHPWMTPNSINRSVEVIVGVGGSFSVTSMDDPNSINRSVEMIVIVGVGGVPSVSPWMTPNSINRSVEVIVGVGGVPSVSVEVIVGVGGVPSVSPPWMTPNSINRSVEVIVGVGGVPSVSPPWMTLTQSIDLWGSFSVTSMDDPIPINRSVEVIVGVGGVPSVSPPWIDP